MSSLNSVVFSFTKRLSCFRRFKMETKYLGPWKGSFVERAITLCPYLGGVTIKGFAVVINICSIHWITQSVCFALCIWSMMVLLWMVTQLLWSGRELVLLLPTGLHGLTVDLALRPVCHVSVHCSIIRPSYHLSVLPPFIILCSNMQVCS